MTPRRLTGGALLLALALTAGACGGGDAATTTTAATTTSIEAATTTTAAVTTTATAETTTTTTAAAPEGVTFVGADGVETTITDTSRIVSLSGDLTEIIFELGLGANVAAIDVTTTYPAEATELPVVGFAQQLAPEPVLAFSPTLVLGDQLTAPPEAIQQLRDAGIPVVILPTQTSLDGVATKITQVAEILGVPEAGTELAARVQGEIDAARAEAFAPDEAPRVVFVYVRGPQTLLLFGQGMATQAMIEGAGAIDAGAETGVRGAVPLSPEALVAAAPDVIVLPEAGLAALGGIDAFAAIPGVADTPAGQAGRFLAYDEAYFFNLGPRTGQALAEFSSDLRDVMQPS